LIEGLGEQSNEISKNKDVVDQNEREKKRVNEIGSEVVPLDILRQERKNRIKRMVATSELKSEVKNRTRAENNQSTKSQTVFDGIGDTGLKATAVNAGQSEASLQKQDSSISATTDAQRMTAIHEKDIAGKDSVEENIVTRDSESLNGVAGIFGFVGARQGLSRASGIDDYPLYIDTPASPVSSVSLFGKDTFGTIGGQTARIEKQPYGTFSKEAVKNKTDHRDHHKIAGFKTETVVMASTTPFSKNGRKTGNFSAAPNGQAATSNFEAGLISTRKNPSNVPVTEGIRVGVSHIVSDENAVHKVSTAQEVSTAEESGRDKQGEQQKAEISRKSQTEFVSEKAFPAGTPATVKKVSGEEKTQNSNFSFPSEQQNEQRKSEIVAEKSTTIFAGSDTNSIGEEGEFLTASFPDTREKSANGQAKELPDGGSGKSSQKASAGDIEDTFEQKRTEFFKRLDHAHSKQLEQDLFPPMSSFDRKNKGKATNHPHPRGYYPSRLSKMLTGRSVTVGIFFIIALVFYAYFSGRFGLSVPLSEQQPQTIATRNEKAGKNPDPAQKVAANLDELNGDAKNLTRKNNNAKPNLKSNSNNLTKKNSDEKFSQSQKSPGQRVKPDRIQTDVSEKLQDAASLTDEKPVVELASLPVSVMRPVVEETPSETVTDEPAVSVKNKPEAPSPETRSAQAEKIGPGLLLVSDKKGNQLKMQSTVTWSLKPPHSSDNPLDETALVADFKTDDGKLGARMSIRKNYRDNLGATHLIDLSFSQADGFDGGVVVDVKGFYYGDKINVLTRQASTIVADLYENNFVASLRDDKENYENNRNFLTRSAVIGFQTVFTDGKTALFMLNKGEAENQLFDRFNDPTTH